MFISRHADLVFTTRTVSAFIAALVLLLPLPIALLEQALPAYALVLRALSWLALGFGLCWLRTLWELFHNLFYSTHTELLVCLSFLFGAVLLLVLAIIKSSTVACLVLYGALALFSAVTASLLLLRLNRTQQEFAIGTQQFSPYITHDITANALQGIVMGCTIATILNLGVSSGVSILIPLAVSLVISGLVVVLVTLLRQQRTYDLALLLDRLLPLATFFFILSPLVNEGARMIFCCIILAILFYGQTRKIILGIVLNNQLHLNPLTHSSLVPLPYVAGAFIGFVAFLYIYSYLGLSGAELFLLTSAGAFTIVIALYLGQIRHNPTIYDRNNRTGEGLNEGAVRPTASGEQKVDDYDDYGRYLDTRCDAIIEKRGLTLKEAEVFRLLVRGRNAEFISNTLFISLATARTHIYHIYAKLEVSSHQQLIDVFEAEALKNRG
ncbi:MAG: helix-turn-helix transcriptional regulator [Coriobacteriales bacterium]|nr:helix-turn-helix transcriptional regulator [Coriobacteriales bacterium]